MKNLWFGFWAEFNLFFRNPREIHRVLLIMPLALLLSHSIYIYYDLPEDYIMTTSDIVAVWLGIIIFSFVCFWCFCSNEMSIDLFNRFAIVSGLSGLFHRIYFYAIELGDPYYQILSTISFVIFGMWAVTGKNYREFKDLYIRPALKHTSKVFYRHEKKDNVVAIADSKFAERG